VPGAVETLHLTTVDLPRLRALNALFGVVFDDTKVTAPLHRMTPI
jgi:hypothetical protein